MHNFEKDPSLRLISTRKINFQTITCSVYQIKNSNFYLLVFYTDPSLVSARIFKKICGQGDILDPLDILVFGSQIGPEDFIQQNPEYSEFVIFNLDVFIEPYN